MDSSIFLAVEAALPSIPRTVALLLAELDRPGAEGLDLQRINQLVAGDPVLAARILQRANAPDFLLQRQVAGVPQALALLSREQLRGVVAAVPVGGSLQAVPGVDLRQFWRYSRRVARQVRSLAGLVHQDQTAAATAGLLHALGELAMVRAEPARMLRVDALAGPLDPRRARAEQRLFGHSYAQVSAALARHWQLPATVIDALEHQHAPFDSDSYEPLAGVVHLASWCARARSSGLGEREMTVSFPAEVGLALSLDIDMVLQQDPFDWTGAQDRH
ncbi:HDOD domain-containing protein [Xylophilus sp.]|uniref:HDOD domain-containing protein n=1 Tax=Xylophilus sp. TaxID=2653893 RepID=UPI0013BB2CA4|nr:HDOD domain-containing protein [Xylophilus sp.]KAF1048715.1 MAG: hypothetical protein GAK38_01159 [Xylophilus sp.]